MIVFEHGDNNPGDAIQKSITASTQAWNDLMSTVQVFQSNINRREIALAECEVARMHSLLDDYADHFLIAGRLIVGDKR